MSENIMYQKLWQQVVEQHAKLVYSFTTDEKEIARILWWAKFRQVISIISSAITVSPALSSLFGHNVWWKFFSAIAGIILLCLSTYNLKTDNDGKVIALRKSADTLWEIREKYISLLVDFDNFTIEEIRDRRDELTKETASVYKNRPKTSLSAYRKAQKALQVEEEQTFNEGEAEQLLPRSLRNRYPTSKH
ncbi:SLATT domain-containing protein [Streptococcus pseudopneumoniae]|uniref:SLATT domain-containing protein n=1 Tax=Streptococcus pseudopneumoniae TaxID=257758 RepID=UPI00066A53CC|nr:SLATT domain-containing protein [Streptococcus pseudopneumoniae]